jgi:hypothetical protein
MRELGGRAVVKVPYSNAGQGVHLLTDHAALARFLQAPQAYDRWCRSWSTTSLAGTVLTDMPMSVPDPTGMVGVTPSICG